MFSLALRIVLIVGSLVTLGFMLWRIRAAKIQIRDSISWILLSFVLLVLSVFPQLAQWASQALRIESPINFVYLIIIFILLIKLFTQSLRISQLDTRLQQLVQRVALYEKAAEDAKDEGKKA